MAGLFNLDELKALVDPLTGLCVSIYLPAHPVVSDMLSAPSNVYGMGDLADGIVREKPGGKPLN